MKVFKIGDLKVIAKLVRNVLLKSQNHGLEVTAPASAALSVAVCMLIHRHA